MDIEYGILDVLVWHPRALLVAEFNLNGPSKLCELWQQKVFVNKITTWSPNILRIVRKIVSVQDQSFVLTSWQLCDGQWVYQAFV